MIEIDLLEKAGVIDSAWITDRNQIEHIVIKDDSNNQLMLIKEYSEDDSFVDKLFCRYPEISDEDKKYEWYSEIYIKIKEKVEEYSKNADANILQVYNLFDNWEKEREVIEVLKSKEKSGVKKNKIERDFALFNTVYFSSSEKITLNVEHEGVNFLKSPELSDETELSGIVINCSFSELKKLYNATGTSLFRSNVRNGIIDDKSEFKSIFEYYLSVEEEDSGDAEDVESSIKYKDYDSELFWFCHNGITLFVDGAIEGACDFQYDLISIKPRACSVINGAQTITNFFSVYSKLKNDYSSSEEDNEKEKNEEKVKKLDELISKIFVKLTIIVGKEAYSPFITKGLNTQRPISNEDFVAITDEVRDINQVSQGYVHILKTGEVEGVGALKPLDFVKWYYIVCSKPGTAKNFKKDSLEKTIKDIHKKLVNRVTEDEVVLNSESQGILNRMVLLPIIEEWWSKKNKEKGSSKGIIDKYGKNYFQSFVVDNFESFNDDDIDLSSIFEKFEQLLSGENSISDYNVFKNDKLYNHILKKYRIQQSSKSDIKDINGSEYKDELFDYLSSVSEAKSKVRYLTEITKFYESKNVNIDNPKVIKRIDGEIVQPIYLSSTTFQALYQNLNIEYKLKKDTEIVNDDFSNYKESDLYDKLNLPYNLFVLDFEGKKLKRVHFLKQQKFDIPYLEAEKLYNQTIKAFIEGNEKLFPKAIKNNKIHVRPKAYNKEDLFLFTNGEQIPKRTFCISKDYINQLLNQKIQLNS